LPQWKKTCENGIVMLAQWQALSASAGFGRFALRRRIRRWGRNPESAANGQHLSSTRGVGLRYYEIAIRI